MHKLMMLLHIGCFLFYIPGLIWTIPIHILLAILTRMPVKH